jgi:hypothetical protein
VNTGVVVAGRDAAARGELMVSGDAVNTAARLQQLAEPGSVAVGERTLRASDRAIRYRPAPAVAAARGKAEPLAAWIAEEAAATAHRGVEGLRAPLVGRDRELAVLDALADRVRYERIPQLVTVYGDAGVGKSRLTREFVERTGVRLLQGRCLPYGDGITYWALGEVAKGHAGVLETDPAPVALAKLRASVTQLMAGEAPDPVLKAVCWTVGLALPGQSVGGDDAAETRRRLHGAWARYLTAIGRERFTALVVEDLHWASDPLLELLEAVTRALDDTALLVVCTARPELLDTHPRWGAGRRDAAALHLDPLRDEQTQELVDALLWRAEGVAGLRGRILERAEGNPFYVEEIVRMMIDRGALRRTPDGWTAGADAGDMPIPDSVHGVIAARVDLLGAAERTALRECAVVGRVFWPAAVGADEALVASLVDRELVQDRPASVMAGMREFAFKHALTRDVAYGSLPRADRRRLHRRVAEWLDRMAPDRTAEMAELVAYHAVQAVEHGDRSAGALELAASHLIAAALAALARGAVDSARRLAERAHGLAAEPRLTGQALLTLARIDQAEAQVAESARSLASQHRLTEARQLFAGIGDRAMEAEALSWRSRINWITGHWDAARADAAEAVRLLEGLPESPQLARALARRSQLDMLRVDPAAAEHAREAVAVARRVGDAFAEVNAEINCLTAEPEAPADPDWLRRTVPKALACGAYDEAYRAIVNFVWTAVSQLPLPEVEALLEEVRPALAGYTPPESFGPYLRLTEAKLLRVPSGRWTDAERLADEAAGPGVGAGTRLLWLEVSGGIALRRGDRGRARPLIAELSSAVQATQEPQRVVPMAALAMAEAALDGDGGRLRELTTLALPYARGAWMDPLGTATMIRALVAAGQPRLVQRWAEAVDAASPGPHLRQLEAALAIARGGLAAASGDPQGGVRELQAATRELAALGNTLEAAKTQAMLADALAAAGEAPAADRARAQASAVLEAVGCVHPL